jgi:hypothetical protein
MRFSVSFAALVAIATAAPTEDTLAVCDYLHEQYPQFLAYNTLGPRALETVANASLYSVSQDSESALNDR